MRCRLYGLPEGMVAARSPGEVLAEQLARLKQAKPVQIELPAELTPYGLRHAFALRLAQQLGLHVREAAELMGHSPQVHLSTYGRRLDQPKLLARVRAQVHGDARGFFVETARQSELQEAGIAELVQYN